MFNKRHLWDPSNPANPLSPLNPNARHILGNPLHRSLFRDPFNPANPLSLLNPSNPLSPLNPFGRHRALHHNTMQMGRRFRHRP